MTKAHAVIPAAGHGARFGSDLNKVLHKLDGATVIEHTVNALSPFVDTITVVASTSDSGTFREIFYGSTVMVVIGAPTRQESVWNGLAAIPSHDGIVLVHDGARPLVPAAVIERCMASATAFGSGVAAVPVVDALKRVNENSDYETIVVSDLDRHGVWAVQTPQAFDLELLRSAHLSAREDGFLGLDEASLVQRITGSQVHLVHGDRWNIKITTQEDLLVAEQHISNKQCPTIRFGIGYDIHRLVEGRPLVLGGVTIPSPVGLDGHSDADVVLHAICDSLLGAAGLPDIGHFFPNTDSAFRNASSLKLLAKVYDVLQEHGFTIGNVDSMLIAERPRIAPYILQMKSAIAGVLKIALDCVSIKATTNEGIGSLGAGEGMACHASATVFQKTT
jgi:2-C-methyl-D-erythritol 4-phosphate cytidylyltransferase / 2-C-methyl-D-erythritol 2,4-cyclodiphosphate synthase